jgi:hypothetical protein
MLKSEIKAGTEYALREKRLPGVAFQRVRIIEHIRGNKWKAEWIEPNPGLIHYVESGQLIVPWKERLSFLKEEESEERLRSQNRLHGYEENSPIANALYTIFESVGDDVSFYKGVLRGSPEALDRVKARAGVASGNDSRIAYKDRSGTIRLPFDEALELARRFCAAEPAAVLVKVEATEREWAQSARRPGEEYIIGLLNEYRAAWALIRQWTGHDAAVAQREAVIERLERLVWDAIYALQKAGLDSESARLRRALERK